MTATFLSEEWFDELRERLSSLPPVGGDTAFRVGEVATGTPSGEDISWTVVLEPGRSPQLETESAVRSDVTLVAGYDALFRLFAGTMTAGELIGSGLLKVSGDARLLIEASDLLRELGVAFTSSPKAP